MARGDRPAPRHAAGRSTVQYRYTTYYCMIDLCKYRYTPTLACKCVRYYCFTTRPGQRAPRTAHRAPRTAHQCHQQRRESAKRSGLPQSEHSSPSREPSRLRHARNSRAASQLPVQPPCSLRRPLLLSTLAPDTHKQEAGVGGTIACHHHKACMAASERLSPCCTHDPCSSLCVGRTRA